MSIRARARRRVRVPDIGRASSAVLAVPRPQARTTCRPFRSTSSTSGAARAAPRAACPQLRAGEGVRRCVASRRTPCSEG